VRRCRFRHLAFTALLFVISLPVEAAARAPGPDPLKDAVFGESGRILVRSRPAGLDLSITAGADFRGEGVWVALRNPNGGWSENHVIKLPSGGGTARAMIRRPWSDVQDRDLRMALSVREPNGKTSRYIGAVSRFHRTPRVVLLGDANIIAGSRFSPRIVVRLGDTDPLAGARVTARLVRDGKGARVAASGSATTDQSGGSDLALRIPPKLKGKHRLEVQVESDEGGAKAAFDVTVQRKSQVLLGTDKPLYQPGQTVHLRILARNAGNGRAAGKAPVRIAIHDAKNNKVFQKRGKTSREGVFATRFDIASMVNTGRWRIEAEVDEVMTERTVEVKPYVLPKFKVKVETKETSYQPGDTVTGTIKANYFFGKPLAGAKVELRAQTFDVSARELARHKLVLDDTGTAEFKVKLPKKLHGQPMLQGAAALRLMARVTDTAGQTYQSSRSLAIWKDKLRVMVLPEAGRLVPGVENIVYVLVSKPDGSPARKARVSIKHRDNVTGAIVDAAGVATWRGVPKGNRFSVTAQTPDGYFVAQTITPQTAPNAAVRVLLRPDNPAPRVGEHVSFDVLVGGAVPHVFMDLVRGGQTIVTLSAPVRNGRARLSTTLPADAAGTLLAHAYALGKDMAVYADTRPLVVRPASDLKITIAPDRKVYRPGQDATINLSVTDRNGHPVLAALGLWVVDEAVFALSELRPGMERVFFLLEKELMKPKVEIHGFHAEHTLEDDDAPLATAKRNLAARVLGAAAMARFNHATKVDSMTQSLGTSRALWATTFAKRYQPYAADLKSWALKRGRMPTGKEFYTLLAGAGLRPGSTRDAFGVPVKLNVNENAGSAMGAHLMSAGPDARWGTADDLRVDLGTRIAQQAIWQRQRKTMLAQRRFRRFFRGGGGGGRGIRGGGRAMRGAPMAKAPMADMGGFDDMQLEGAMARPDPAPEPKAASGPKLAEAETSREAQNGKKDGGSSAPRVRSYFPETLYVNPLVVTGEDGKAQVRFPVADSITTWRMSALASSGSGGLGSTDQGIKVFQDFFVDLDLPVALTQGDEVSVPLAVYNYMDEPQTVSLQIKTAGGVAVSGKRELSLMLSPGEVRGVSVDLFASHVGSGRITVVAKGTHLSDAVRRDVRVAPDGFDVVSTESGMLDARKQVHVDVPEGAIEGANTLQVKLYPGMFAQVVDGLEGILRMPGGCFEQTSSSTYPNILVLRYLRDAGKAKPELEAKALKYLQAGWQRLVTFEVPGGGFSWFGQAPANRILTAYGVMEFHDMNRVFSIDEKVIARTRKWLLRQQNANGSFSPDKSFLHQESWGDIQKSNVLVSAYITWALAYTRPNRQKIEPALARALTWLRNNSQKADDAYVLAYLANAFAEAAADRSDAAQDRATTRDFLKRLAAKVVSDDDSLHFPTKLRTATYGDGRSATIEVTSLALRAFMRAQSFMDNVGPGLKWLVSTKSPSGNWHTTQATIQVLQAMVSSLSAQQEATAGKVDVLVNGESVAEVSYTEDDFDVVRFIDASKSLQPGSNTIELLPSNGMKAMYTVTRTSYLPWTDRRAPKPRKQAFDVSVDYDRTTLAKDDTVGVTVTVKSNLPKTAKMGLVDVAVPPGFVVQAASLEAAVKSEKLQRYSLAGRQIILYVPEFAPRKPFVIKYKLKARFPLKVSTGATRAYEYYNPANAGVSAPGKMSVSR